MLKTDLEEERNCLQVLLTNLRMKLVNGKKLNKRLTCRDFPGGSDGKAFAYNAETQIQSLGQEDLLEEEMATHFSILAWKIPWTEEPGRLRSRGSQRVRHG